MRKKYRWDKDTKTFIEFRKEDKIVNAPNVIQDSMDALKHHGDGRMYDSKSNFRKTTKRLGFEERGDAESVADNIPKFKNTSEDDYVAATKQAWAMCESGNAPLNEYEREVCKRIDERLRNR